MTLKEEFHRMMTKISNTYTIPCVSRIFFPKVYKGGQPKDAQFMAMGLEGGAAGISYVLLPDAREGYNSLALKDFAGRNPFDFAFQFGSEDPVREMISLAAINAVCQHVMKEIGFEIKTAVDSFGLLNPSPGDRIGMVGLFSGMVKPIRAAGAELVIIEKNQDLLEKNPDLPITLDPTQLSACNKVLCTSTTLLNHSLDNILEHCSTAAQVSVVGPTAGYFPDPLFARGVTVVGGRVVQDGDLFFELVEQGKNWGKATRMTCFERGNYRSPVL